MFKVLMYLILCGTAVHALTGCSINVVHADGATFAYASDLSQNAVQVQPALCLGTDAGLIE